MNIKDLSPRATKYVARPVALSGAKQDIDNSTSKLHKVFAESIQEVLYDLDIAQVPLRVYEGFRSPSRQAFLNRATGEPLPWRSMHQFGLAVDLAIWEDGQWKFDTTRQFDWSILEPISMVHGLHTVPGEPGHLEVSWADIADLSKGMLPAGGGDTWWDNLSKHLASWEGTPSAPAWTPDQPAKPPLTEEEERDLAEYLLEQSVKSDIQSNE